MSISPARRWLARALRALLASILIATLLGSLEERLSDYASGFAAGLGDELRGGLGENAQHFPWLASFGRSSRVLTEAKFEVKHAYQKTITVDADEGGVAVTYDLYLDKGDPLFERLRKTAARPVASWGDEEGQIVYGIFGLVLLTDRMEGYELPELEVDAVTSIAHFRLRGKHLKYEESAEGANAPSYRVVVFGGRLDADVSELIVNTRGVRVVPVTAVPRSQAWNRTHFTDLRHDEDDLEFDLVPLAGGGNEAAAKPISYTLGRFNAGYYPAIQPLLLGLFYGLPFFLFLRLRRHADLASDTPVALFFSLSLLVLVLYSGVALLRCLTTIVYEVRLYKLQNKFEALRVIGDPGEGATALLVFFVAILWPRMVRRWEKAQGGALAGPAALLQQPRAAEFRVGASAAGDARHFLREPRPRAASVAGTLSLLLWLAFWVLVSGRNDFNFTAGPVAAFADYGALEPLSDVALWLWFAALYASCAWLLYELSGRPLAALTGAAAAFALIALVPLDELGFALWLGVPLAALLLVPFVFSFARVAYPALGGTLFADAWGGRSLPVRLWAVVAAAAFALLLVWPGRGEFQSSASSWLVFSAAWALGRLWVFGLLAVLLRALRNLSERVAATGRELDPAARAVGEVFALTFFFLPAQRWLYLPVVFLLGYALLKKWLFVPPPPHEGAESREQVRRLVRETVSLHDAESGLRLARKEMLARLGKGDVEYEEYAKKVNSLDDVVEEKRRAMLESRGGGAAALRFGPAASAWERGRFFAWHGLLFALPWTILFVHNVTQRPAPNDNVELLALITSAALALAQWPLYGLFLGYFYPHVRGSNGMLKGLFFCVFILLPMFAANVVANPTDATAWKTFFLWALQLFIQCMLLGFVTGDYETLRRAGLGRRHLIDVHNLGALAAWGSGVLVAIGAAVTTLLTTGAASLIGSGLKVLLPDVLPNVLPTPTPGGP